MCMGESGVGGEGRETQVRMCVEGNRNEGLCGERQR